MKKLLIALAFCFMGSFYATEEKSKAIVKYIENPFSALVKNRHDNFELSIKDELIVGTNAEVSSHKKLPELVPIRIIGWKYPFN